MSRRSVQPQILRDYEHAKLHATVNEIATKVKTLKSDEQFKLTVLSKISEFKKYAVKREQALIALVRKLQKTMLRMIRTQNALADALSNHDQKGILDAAKEFHFSHYPKL